MLIWHLQKQKEHALFTLIWHFPEKKTNSTRTQAGGVTLRFLQIK